MTKFRRFRRWLSDRLADNISAGSKIHIAIDKTLDRIEAANIWLWKKMIVRLVEWYSKLRRNGNGHDEPKGDE